MEKEKSFIDYQKEGYKKVMPFYNKSINILFFLAYYLAYINLIIRLIWFKPSLLLIFASTFGIFYMEFIMFKQKIFKEIETIKLTKK